MGEHWLTIPFIKLKFGNKNIPMAYKNDPLLTCRDNGFYDEAEHYLIFQYKLQRWIVKITLTIAG